MIDSISISKTICDSEKEVLISNLDNIRENVLMDTGEIRIQATVRGKMNVYLRGDFLTIRGSLSQFYLQSDESLKFYQIDNAIKLLEKLTGINLFTSYVDRLDLEGTFSIKFKIYSYYSCLGQSQYFNRFIEKHTLYYSNGSRKKCFYHKSRKSQKDYDLENKQSTLRFEVRYFKEYMKIIGEKLRGRRLQVKDLLQADFQKSLLDLWYEEYVSILKINILQMDMSSVTNLADMKRELQAHAIQNLGGIGNVIDLIENSRYTNPKLDTKTVSRIKSGMKNMSAHSLSTIVHLQLTELNSLMVFKYNENLLTIYESNKNNTIEKGK